MEGRRPPGGGGVPTVHANYGWARFSFRAAHEGQYYLWARMFYPGGRDVALQGKMADNWPNSFYVRIDGGEPKLLGNLKHGPGGQTSYYFRRWHWDGDGHVETGNPTPLALGRLKAGRHRIELFNRDAVEIPGCQIAARLEALCITAEARYVPNDRDCFRALRARLGKRIRRAK